MTPPAQPIYLDHNATTPPLPEVVDAVSEALQTCYGNPSSPHRQGEPARRMLQRARGCLQQHLDAASDTFVFTGSGTEANNLALRSLARNGRFIVTSAIEHSSVLRSASRLSNGGGRVEIVPVTPDGVVDLQAIRQRLQTAPNAALSVQWVNNETGVIQPIREVVELAREYGAVVHIDAAQAVGKVNISVQDLDPDLLTLTAHKFNGPAGVGVLYASRPAMIDPLCVGGAQQDGWHAGTENIAGIAGLARALASRYAALDRAIAKMGDLRDTFEGKILEACPWARVNGRRDQRVCNTTNLCFDGIDGQALLGRLDARGVYCSQSSACTSGLPEPSDVLRAMGLSVEQAYSSVRFSFGVTNTEEEATRAAAIVAEEAQFLKRMFA